MRFTTNFDPEIAQKVGLLEAILHAWLREQALFQQHKLQSEDAEIGLDVPYFSKVFSFAKPEHIERAVKRLIDGKYVTQNGKQLRVEAEKQKAPRRSKAVAPVIPADVKVITYRMRDEYGIEKDIETTKMKLIAELVDAFREVNPNYRSFFGHRGHRAALERMIDNDVGYSIPDIFGMIHVLPQTNVMPFAPVITSPSELEHKAAKLMAFVQKEKGRLHDSDRFKTVF